MSNGLLYGLGLVGVVWAVFEGLRLFGAARPREPEEAPPSRSRPSLLAGRELKTWDARGRRRDFDEIR